MNEKKIHENIYFSLDEARNELRLRLLDKKLRKAVTDELGDEIFPEFEKSPRGLIWKSIISPDNSIFFFNFCCQYLNINPLGFEFLGDVYLSINEEKRGLGKIRLFDANKGPVTVNLFDLHKWNKRPFTEITIKDGASLIDFHHSYFNNSDSKFEIVDKTSWAKSKGRASDWYYLFFLHFVTHGILFESYTSSTEDYFFESTVKPALEKIRFKFGVSPVIVRPFPEPESQTASEDFFWWSYPKSINEKILEYIQANNYVLLSIKNNL